MQAKRALNRQTAGEQERMLILWAIVFTIPKPVLETCLKSKKKDGCRYLCQVVKSNFYVILIFILRNN